MPTPSLALIYLYGATRSCRIDAIQTPRKITMKDNSDRPITTHDPHPEGRRRSTVDLEIRAELGNQLRDILVKTDLKQKEIAKILAVQQPEVSHLVNGHFKRFTIGKLIQFLDRLGWSVQFTIHQRQLDSH